MKKRAILTLVIIAIVSYFVWKFFADDHSSLDQNTDVGESTTIKRIKALMPTNSSSLAPIVPTPWPSPLPADEFIGQVKKDFDSSHDFLAKCEEDMDKALEEYVSQNPRDVFLNEKLAWDKLNQFKTIQIQNVALSHAYELFLHHTNLVEDNWMVEHANEMRPCRPFMAIEFWTRLLDGVSAQAWSPEFTQEIHDSMITFLRQSLAGESRVFSLGLYLGLLKKMVAVKMLPAEMESDLKRLEEQAGEFSETIRAQLEARGSDPDIKGAGKLVVQDIQEAKKIREDLLTLLQEIPSE